MMLKLYYFDCKIEVYEFLYDKYINCIGDCLYIFVFFFNFKYIYYVKEIVFFLGGGGVWGI